MQGCDEYLRLEAAKIIEERNLSDLEGLVGSVQAVIINTEPKLQKSASKELMKYSGLEFQEAFMDSLQCTCVLRISGSPKFRSADFLVRSR